jgi:hypothetical protein
MTLKIPLALSLILMVVAGSALAAGTAIDLNLQGGTANQNIRVCGSTHHYVVYKARRRVDFKGTLSTAPSKPGLVMVKIKKCVRGRFVRFREVHVRVNSRGLYQGSFTIAAKGLYFARTYNYAAGSAGKSAKRHFRIR